MSVWAPEELSPLAARGGIALKEQIAAFESEHPTIQIKYVLKAAYGKGGITDFVLQVNDLIPNRLPDILVVDSREVEFLARANLVQPLHRDFPAGVFLDLFAPAQTLASRNGVFTSLPAVIEAEHIIHDLKRVPTPPATWDQLIQSRQPFAFAADSTDPFLFHYLENGGVLGAAPSAEISQGALVTVLSFYQRLRRTDVLGGSALGLRTSVEVLPLFTAGQVALAQIQARDYINERARLSSAGFAPIPTRDGRATTLVTAWTYILVARPATSGGDNGQLREDEVLRAQARRQAAVQLIGWLNDPTRLAEWAKAAQRIPARKSAFAAAVAPPDYADFLWALLENGIAAPSHAVQAPYVQVWHNVLQLVLRGQLAPDAAATTIIQNLAH